MIRLNRGISTIVSENIRYRNDFSERIFIALYTRCKNIGIEREDPSLSC